MERTEYPAMLGALQPGQAVDVLNDRVRQVGRLNTEIAGWLAERRRLEELYANGMRKLAQRNIDGLDLGIFSVPWSTLTSSAGKQADSHASLASKIEVDVEQPLRNFGDSNREMQSMTTMQGNLGALAKDVDRAQQKVEKLQTKGNTDNSKLTGANSELENAHSQWDSQAPYVFENLQAVDEARLNHLRDVLTQFQTHEVDQVERSRVASEHCLNVLLNIETADEIKTFALRSVANRPRLERPARADLNVPVASNLAASSSRPNLAPTLSQTGTEEEASQREPSFQDDESKKRSIKGLRRLSTVMGRRKDRTSKAIVPLESMSETPEKKPRSSPFSAFSRSGKKKGAMILEPMEGLPQQRPHSPLRIGSEILEQAPIQEEDEEEDPTVLSSPTHDRPTALNGDTSNTGAVAEFAGNILNGSSHQGDLAGLAAPAPSEPQVHPTEQARDAEGFSIPSREVDAITQAQQEAAAALEGIPPQFNVNIKNAPIQNERGADADAALASMATKLQMQAPQPQRRGGTVRGRRDGRFSVFAPASEPSVPSHSTLPGTDPSAALAALEGHPGSAGENASPFDPSASTSSAQTAQVLPQQVSPSLPSASSFVSFPPSTEGASPMRVASRAVGPEHTGTDSQSIRSGRSLTSTGSQGLKHPELTHSGLNASIIETVSARFENGKLAHSSIVGEIAMAYNPPDFSTPFGTDNIKLEHFESLEKVAPNPAFVNPSATNREGEYTVNLGGISKTQVAFKYQARSDVSGSHAPLLLTPAFKIEATQASIIVGYSLNPAFALHGRESITLSNVMLALTLEGAKATGCQSRPAGTFSRERNLIFWQLGDVILKPGVAPQKLLARFTTESEAKTGSAEAKWELSGNQAASLGSGLSVSVHGQSGATDGTDPFADESAQGAAAAWKSVHMVKKLTTGSYSAK